MSASVFISICLKPQFYQPGSIKSQDEDGFLMSRWAGKSAKPSTTLHSKQKRADSALPLTSKHPNSQASTQAQDILQDAGHMFLQPGLPASVMQCVMGSLNHLPSAQVKSTGQSGVRTLKSAFRPPPSAFQWSWDVPLADYQFTCSTAQYEPDGEVRITRVSEKLEVIAIAEDWLKGEEMWEKSEQHYQTGFIGHGFMKCGIYVCPKCFQALTDN